MSARSSDAPERLIAFFSGHVQGVGFRFAAVDLASSDPALTGLVRNLPDGRVELIAEGPRASLDHLLDAVQRRMRPYISQAESSRGPATGEFSGFDIAR